MQNKVFDTIEKYNMLKKSERVAVGLSGGADSVSLLLCLIELGYDVVACHVNHQLRGDESLRDEQFCVDLCSKLGIPIEVHRIDVAKYCKDNSCSVEEGARKLRYDIFKSIKAEKIATAHTLSDNFETLLFNLTRGTGLKGLCSIPPVRDNIVRPLIECTREEVIYYLDSKNQGYVTDSTNLETDYSRNKIRIKAVPVLKEINPSLLSTFEKTLDNLKADEDYLELMTDKLLNDAKVDSGYRADVLSDAHDSIKRRAVAKILAENGVRYSFDSITDVVTIINDGGKINLQSDIYAICENNIFSINEIKNIENVSICIPIETDLEYVFLGRRFCAEVFSCNSQNIHKMLAKKPLDYGKIKGKLYIKNRDNGDRIQLCGRDFTSSVKKLFNAKVPIDMRDKTVILCDDDGIIWIEGFGCAERVKVDNSTKSIMVCKIS
ncbi:MAG: tRNA lysidine(34) synthetase TilS [Ruminococcus sp.]|nr:tRNA lysidine(34) synthetase TilS [Ruminococcus sp.]